jgi:hypothetical protein
MGQTSEEKIGFVPVEALALVELTGSSFLEKRNPKRESLGVNHAC